MFHPSQILLYPFTHKKEKKEKKRKILLYPAARTPPPPPPPPKKKKKNLKSLSTFPVGFLATKQILKLTIKQDYRENHHRYCFGFCNGALQLDSPCWSRLGTLGFDGSFL